MKTTSHNDSCFKKVWAVQLQTTDISIDNVNLSLFCYQTRHNFLLYWCQWSNSQQTTYYRPRSAKWHGGSHETRSSSWQWGMRWKLFKSLLTFRKILPYFYHMTCSGFPKKLSSLHLMFIFLEREQFVDTYLILALAACARNAFIPAKPVHCCAASPFRI